MLQRPASHASRALRSTSSQPSLRGSALGPSWTEGGPFALLRQLDEDMSRLFDEFYSGRPWGGEQHGDSGAWLPPLEMHQRDGRLHVCADLPGMSKDDIKVDLADGQLTIQGERRQESRSDHGQENEGSGGYYRSERSYGSFYRSIALPDGVDLNSAQATFRDGVLDISFAAPKQDTQRGRRLEIGDGPSSDTAPGISRSGSGTGSSAGVDMPPGG